MIRHLLTALGTVLTLLGLNEFAGVIDYITEMFEPLYGAVGTVVGVIITIIGFFNGRKDEKEIPNE